MYKINYHPQARKFIKKINLKDAERVVQKLAQLTKNPFAQEIHAKKMTASGKTYRLRIGNIRVVYELDTKSKIIYIHDIDFRGNIY